MLGGVELQAGARKHADAAKPLSLWRKIVLSARWESLVQLHGDFPSADYVRPFTVFNIGGNKYRLIAVVDYADGVVTIRAFLTHAEYTKGRWKK